MHYSPCLTTPVKHLHFQHQIPVAIYDKKNKRIILCLHSYITLKH